MDAESFCAEKRVQKSRRGIVYSVWNRDFVSIGRTFEAILTRRHKTNLVHISKRIQINIYANQWGKNHNRTQNLPQAFW